MNSEQAGLPTTPESTTSSQLSIDEAPLVSLLTMQGLKPKSEMTEEELRTWLKRLRNNRTSVQTLRSEVQKEAAVRKEAKAEPKVDLSEYV